MSSKSLAKNAVYKTILNIFNLIVPLLIGPYVTRIITEDLMASYNTAYSNFQVFFVIGAFGIYNYGMREISKIRDDKQKINRLFTSLFLLGVVSNVLTIAYFLFFYLSHTSGVDTSIYFIMILRLISNIFYIEFINEAIENYGFITKKTIIVRLFYLLSIFLFVRKSDDVLPYTFIICMTVVINNIISYFYLKKSIEFDFECLDIFTHIGPLIVSLLLTNVEILYSTVDRIMLGEYVSKNAVNYYTIPYNISGMIFTIPQSLITVAIPRLSHRIGTGDKKGYCETLNQTIDIFMALLIPMCIGVAVLAYEVLYLYCGNQYLSSLGFMSAVMIAACIQRIVLGYQCIVSNLVMYANSLEKALVLFLGIFGFCNVGLNYFLLYIGEFTSLTSLFTTSISYLLFIVITSFYSMKRLDIKYKLLSKRILGYFIVCACFFPIAYAIRLIEVNYLIHIVLISGICSLLYGIYLYVTKDPLLKIIVEKMKLQKLITKLHLKI